MKTETDFKKLYDVTTFKLLGLIGVLLLVNIYIYFFCGGKPEVNGEVIESINDIFNPALSSEFKEEIKFKPIDFGVPSFRLKLINYAPSEVLVIMNDDKINIVDSKKYLNFLMTTLPYEASSLRYILTAYFVGSCLFPSGTLNIGYGTNRTIVNGNIYSTSTLFTPTIRALSDAKVQK